MRSRTKLRLQLLLGTALVAAPLSAMAQPVADVSAGAPAAQPAAETADQQPTGLADIVVTATGLKLQLLSGLGVTVDGERVDMAKTMSYKGMMYSGVPNLASAFGYTNASWTLKCDLTCEYVCRLINHMDRTGQPICTPKPDPTVGEAPWLDFSSGYVQRGIDQFPKQGTKTPWKLHQNYALDLVSLRFGSVDDGVMQFSKPPARASQDLAA